MTAYRRRRKVGASTTRSVPRVASTLAWHKTVGFFVIDWEIFAVRRLAAFTPHARPRTYPESTLRPFLVKGVAMFTDTFSKLHLPAAAPMTLQTVREAARRVRIAFCALHGHDLLLHFERGRRVCLRCVNCGHETPGWSTR